MAARGKSAKHGLLRQSRERRGAGGRAAARAAAGLPGLVRQPRLAAARAPDRPAGEDRRAPLDPADRADRLGQDAGRLPAEPGGAGRTQARAGRAQRAHAVRVAAEGAGRRRGAQPAHPAGADAAADPRRDAHRRHVRLAQAAPARPPARHPAHHARADRAAAVACRRAALPGRPRHRHPRRAACAEPHQARRPAGARPRPPADASRRATCASACRPPWRGRANCAPT